MFPVSARPHWRWRLPVPSLEVGAAPGHGLNRDRGGGARSGGDVERGGEGGGGICGVAGGRLAVRHGWARDGDGDGVW